MGSAGLPKGPGGSPPLIIIYRLRLRLLGVGNTVMFRSFSTRLIVSAFCYIGKSGGPGLGFIAFSASMISMIGISASASVYDWANISTVSWSGGRLLTQTESIVLMQIAAATKTIFIEI